MSHEPAADSPPPSAPHSAEGSHRGVLHWSGVLRNTLLVIVLLIMLWLAFNMRLPSIGELQFRIEELGWIGVAAFVVLYAAVAMTPIPVTIMAVTGGLLFGTVIGSFLSVIGVLIGCWGAYWLARSLGKETVLKLLGEHGRKVEGYLRGAGFQAVCTLRLMPGIPYWPINYGSGAFGIGQRDFLVASVVSTIPGQISLVAIGAFIAEPSALTAAVVLCAWAVVLGMTVWASRAWKGSSTHKLPGS